MRERLFRAVLSRWEEKIPDWVQRIQLQILLNATAEGFGRKPFRIWHLKGADGLKAYGAFTKACMAGETVSGQRLYDVAYRLGAMLRHVTGFTEQRDLERLLFFLYRGIGITMTGSLTEELTVSRCFFSTLYASEQCRSISAMDSGIVGGLCGGGELNFVHRITEGCGCCTAQYQGEK